MSLDIAEGGQTPRDLQAQSQIMMDKREEKRADHYGCTFIVEAEFEMLVQKGQNAKKLRIVLHS
jgi:hypothetical protein